MGPTTIRITSRMGCPFRHAEDDEWVGVELSVECTHELGSGDDCSMGHGFPPSCPLRERPTLVVAKMGGDDGTETD